MCRHYEELSLERTLKVAIASRVALRLVSNSNMSDDEEDTHCPLCVEEMDDSDKNFIPCPCGYRVRQLTIVSRIFVYSNLSSHVAPLSFAMHSRIPYSS